MASAANPGVSWLTPLVFTRLVASSTEVAWEIVSDMSAFGDAAPNLSKAEVLDGAGEGMQRRCFDSRGRGWDEVCTLWDECHAMLDNWQEEIESRFQARVR